MSEKIITPSSTPENSFAPKWIGKYSIPLVKFNGNCLRQDSISFIHRNVVSLYISYKLDTWLRDLNTDFMLGNSFFGAVKLTKNADPDKYGYSGYGIGIRCTFLVKVLHKD